MTLFIEIALGVNGFFALFCAYLWLFHRKTYWPPVRDLVEKLLEL